MKCRICDEEIENDYQEVCDECQQRARDDDEREAELEREEREGML